MKQKILKILIIIIIIISVAFIFNKIYIEYRISQAGLSDYYEKYARECSSISFYSDSFINCCFGTIVGLAKEGEILTDYDNYKNNNGCPEGLTALGIACRGGHGYCAKMDFRK
jgi:hypothetical protein